MRHGHLAHQLRLLAGAGTIGTFAAAAAALDRAALLCGPVTYLPEGWRHRSGPRRCPSCATRTRRARTPR